MNGTAVQASEYRSYFWVIPRSEIAEQGTRVSIGAPERYIVVGIRFQSVNFLIRAPRKLRSDQQTFHGQSHLHGHEDDD
jgi:hypothetical protein